MSDQHWGVGYVARGLMGGGESSRSVRGGCFVESRCRAECWGGNNEVGVVCSLITQVPSNMSDTAKGSDVCGWAGGEEGGRGAWAPDGLGGLFCAGECWGRGQLQEGMQASSQLPTTVFHACCPYICNHACCPYIYAMECRHLMSPLS